MFHWTQQWCNANVEKKHGLNVYSSYLLYTLKKYFVKFPVHKYKIVYEKSDEWIINVQETLLKMVDPTN